MSSLDIVWTTLVGATTAALLVGWAASLVQLVIRLFAQRSVQSTADETAVLQALRAAGFTPAQRRASMQLMFQGPEHRNRTVRKVEFLSPDVVRYQLSLDVTYPDGAAGSEPTLLPLVLVRKTKLSGVDLVDESGRSVPIVNRDSEQRLVTLLLCVLWKSLFPSDNLDARTVVTLYRMVVDDPPSAIQHYQALLALLPAVDDRDKLRRFATSAGAFVDSGQLFAHVQDARPGTRHIYKVAFLDDAPWRYASLQTALREFIQRALGKPISNAVETILERRSPDIARQPDLHIRGRQVLEELDIRLGDPGRASAGRALLRDVAGLARGLLSRAGLMSRPYGGQFSTFFSASEHLEVSAPPGTIFSGGHLTVVPPGHAGGRPQQLDGVRRGATIAHLHCSHAAGAVPGPREFEVRLRSMRRGWLLSASMSVLVTTALLWAAYNKRNLLAAGTNTNLIAIALGIGAVAVVYLARPNEHAMTTRLLEGPRLALVTTASAALVAISLLALAPGQAPNSASMSGPTFAEDAAIPALMATGSAAILVLNYVGWALGTALGWRRTRVTRVDP